MNSVFDSKRIRKWLSGNTWPIPLSSAHISITGENPINEKSLYSFLKEYGKPAQPISQNTDLLIVGRKGFDEEGIKKLIWWRAGKTLKIYTQEMFLAHIFVKNPFQKKTVANAFGNGHPAIKYVISLGVEWPSLDVLRKRVAPGYSSWSSAKDRPTISPLKLMKYKVGNNGKSSTERQDILKKAYAESLEKYRDKLPDSYLEEWGKPKSSDRLEKIVNCLSSFYHKNLAKMNNGKGNAEAVKNYADDLKWLKKNYFDRSPRKFRFSWPEGLD